MTYVRTFICGLSGAYLFYVLHLPVPWLLGSLVTIFILQFFTPLTLKWSKQCRDIGLIVVGLSLGSFFTKALFAQLIGFLPLMIGLNICLLLFSLCLAAMTAKWCRIDFQSALVASLPGGFSQLVVFAEEKKSLNLPFITYFHVVRVLLVVSLVPIIFSAHTAASFTHADSPVIYVMILLGAGYLAMQLARFLHIPVAAFLGPMLLIIVLSFTSLPQVHMPVNLLHVAQIFIGCHIGLSLRKKDVAFSKRILLTGIGSALSLISFTFLTAWIFQYFLPTHAFQTAFLSLAPGGLDQMSLIALGVGGDVAVVTVFQLFRILLIYICILPLLQKGIK